MYKKYVNATAVTAHDSNEISGYSGISWDAIYVGVSGDINMKLIGDSSAIVFKNMIQGTMYPLGSNLIKSTSTTATDIVVLDSGRYLS